MMVASIKLIHENYIDHVAVSGLKPTSSVSWHSLQKRGVVPTALLEVQLSQFMLHTCF